MLEQLLTKFHALRDLLIYIDDRYLPDKAIDLVDEAASALRLAQESKPDELEELNRWIVTLE